MNFQELNSVYFLGIGGIGMSALARFFHATGKAVGGYDRTETALTRSLISEGIEIHYSDNTAIISQPFLNPETTLIVRTPAVPDSHDELNFFMKNGFTVMKRAQVLGLIFNAKKGVAIAGTHGKTSVTTFTSFILRECGIDASAFLGGISKNYNTNLLIGNSEYVVAEADEFDRSFLHLAPQVLLITTIDADHLDIYSDLNDIKNTFNDFISKTNPGGTVIVNDKVQIDIPEKVKKLSYSLHNKDADIYASDIIIERNAYNFTFNCPAGSFPGFELKIPGITNVENAVAALAVAYALNIDINKLKKALPGLRGVVRRFDIQFAGRKRIYIDDYAHHPREIDAVLSSLRHLYKNRKITGIFQPHLFSRTKDFADEFAESLSKFDELILLDIYPAREKPLPGVTSDMLFGKIKLAEKHRCSKENLLSKLKVLNIDVLLTIGAGDIDQMIEPIKEYLNETEEI